MSSQGEKDHYSILEVSPSATLKEIKRARNLRLKLYNPDLFPDDPEMRQEAERRSKAVNAAYEVLSDPDSRALYDRHLGVSSTERTELAKLYERAMRAMQQSNWPVAIDLLTQVLAIDGGYRDGSAKLGSARQSQEQEVTQVDLAGLYVQAMASIRSEDWDQAISVLEEIIAIDPDYADVDDLLSETRKERGAMLEEHRRQQDLSRLYDDALRNYEYGRWQEAMDLFARVLSEQPEYRDASKLLEDASRQRDVEGLYDDASQSMQQEQWEAAIQKLEEIQRIDRNFKDVSIKLRACRRAVDDQDKQQELSHLYALAMDYYDKGQYGKAVSSFGQVLSREAEYRDSAQRLQDAEAKSKEQEARFRELYAKADLELASGEWQAALAALNTIYQTDPEYRDVKVRRQEAQAALGREQSSFLGLGNLWNRVLGGLALPASAAGTKGARDTGVGQTAPSSSPEPQGAKHESSASDSRPKFSIWWLVGILGILAILACIFAVLILVLPRTGSAPQAVPPTQAAYQTNIVPTTETVHQTNTVPPTETVHQTNTVPPTETVRQTNTVPPTEAVHQTNTVPPTQVLHETNTVTPTQAMHQTNTVQPTRTPTSVITATPASTRTPAATRTSKPAPTPSQGQATAEPPVAPTEEAESAQMQFPAPALSSPQDGQVFTLRDSVLLQWNPVGKLAADAYYEVTLTYTHLGETWPDEIPWLKEPQWMMSDHVYLQDLSDDGLFRWSVQVMRQRGQDAQGKPTGTALSPISEERTLIWRESEPSVGPGH